MQLGITRNFEDCVKRTQNIDHIRMFLLKSLPNLHSESSLGDVVAVFFLYVRFFSLTNGMAVHESIYAKKVAQSFKSGDDCSQHFGFMKKKIETI